MKIFAVRHGETGLALLFLDMPNRFFWKIKCDSASITLAEQASREVTVSIVNRTLHLQDRRPMVIAGISEGVAPHGQAPGVTDKTVDTVYAIIVRLLPVCEFFNKPAPRSFIQAPGVVGSCRFTKFA